MSWQFVLWLCVVTVVVIIVSRRLFLVRKVRRLSKQVASITLPEDAQRTQGIEDYLKQKSDSFFIDIETDLNSTFENHIISATEREEYINRYSDIYYEADALYKKIELFRIKSSENMAKFISDFRNIDTLIKEHNEYVIQNILDSNKNFFDHCLKYPLDKQQRRSIVSEEDNCLVVSSAGSGKTSSIIGKVKYLIEIKGIDPSRILLISYTNKAASELTERMSIAGLRGYTFHKLAVDMIGQVTGIKPTICDDTDALFVKIYHTLLDEDVSFKKSIADYIMYYQSEETDVVQQRREHLSEQKNARYKAIFPDMDGKTIYVKSEQEQKICSALYSLSLRFRYEEPYEYQLADEKHAQYRPDFSIYYEQEGELKRIYLEHFGVDEHGLVPIWFAKDKNISYEEANRKYNDGITWKIEAHKKFGTELITTSSADFRHFDVKDKLKELLSKAGVPFQERTAAELYNSVLPKDSKQEKVCIRFVVTFITLIKTSCKSLKKIQYQASIKNDERSELIIKNIIMPVYERYNAILKERGQIDFTDAILQATEICRTHHPARYDYIIVDEFQDISTDRYNFLRALRETNPPAKLYCVGDDWQSIYRFSGSDMALFNHFPDYFGGTEINKIETTYRFGEPLVSLSSQFIQRNQSQIKKDIHPFNPEAKTELLFYAYDKTNYCNIVEQIISQVPPDKSIFLLGRYSFDDYYLSYKYKPVKRGNKYFYIIGGREIEFLTVHKSKGLEADYVILLQCNKDTYGFPSLISDDRVLDYVLTGSDQFPYGEERRLFYVAITRARIKTAILYDSRIPSVFVDEFLHPEQVSDVSYSKYSNANKRWTRSADRFLLTLYQEGKSIRYISEKMGRSQTSIIMRLGKLSDS